MTAPDRDEPTIDDVLEPTEDVRPDRRSHAKTPRHLDEDDLERRTQHEREEIADER